MSVNKGGEVPDTPSIVGAMKASCSHYGKCSGCTLQHFPYVKQIHDKGRLVAEKLSGLLAPAAAVPPLLQPVFASPAPLAYRTSSKLCLHEDEIGRRSIGLYQRASKKVVDIPTCPVHHPEINRLLGRLFYPGFPPPAPFYQHGKKAFQSGRLKFLTVRYCPESQEFGLVISHTGVARETLEAWAARIKVPRLCLYESLLTPADDDLILSRQVQHLFGPKTFAFSIGGTRFQLTPLAFFQANSSLTPAFIQTITQQLEGDILLDLYGGFGAYSLPLAGSFEKIYIVESNSHAIAAAEACIAAQGLKTLAPQCASVEDFLERLLSSPEAARVTHIIANPPRGGLSLAVKRALLQGRLPQLQTLTYVSCHIETLRNDLQQLRAGLSIESITPFDMFPQTDHIELVAKLRVAALTGSKKGLSQAIVPAVPASRSRKNSRPRGSQQTLPPTARAPRSKKPRP